MSSHYVKDFPSGSFTLDEDDLIVTRAMFQRMADYSRSYPTAPSTGRIWKSNRGWPADVPDQWVGHIVGASFVHHYPLVVVESVSAELVARSHFRLYQQDLVAFYEYRAGLLERYPQP